jgi:3-deoxy-D-manno-octulosonic-acid transferase
VFSWIIGITFLKLIYGPLVFLLKTIFYFLPIVRNRIKFEKKNRLDTGSRSFSKTGGKADYCFEFSSEGEFQQVASLIEDALNEGKKIELVYFSPSVEKTIYDLYAKFPDSLRFLRYSIFDLSFSKWITASELFLVRYDLFPEFFIWSLKPEHHLNMVWVTFKKERTLKKGIPFFKRIFLNNSEKIVFASQQDLKTAKDYGFNGTFFDFRIEQIRRRILKRDQTLSQKFSHFSQLQSFFLKVPFKNRIIFGNVWPEDIFLLKDLPSDYRCLIIPHKLDPDIIKKMSAELDALKLSYQSLTEEEFAGADSQIIILVKKGVLCELYSDFSRAYVGGGFGESIHSILEPLVAGCKSIACGPVHFRSTEFDIADSMKMLTVVNSSQEFGDWLGQDFAQTQLHDKLESYFESYPLFRKDLLSC